LNGIPDNCDITTGTSADIDNNGNPDECDPNFVRADANSDGLVDISDAVFIMYGLFVDGPAGFCEDANDSNDDGQKDISDVVWILYYQFNSGAQPPSPFPNCGVDSTPDPLSCGGSPACP